MTDNVCHVCGDTVYSYDARGAWCKKHYDEDREAKHAESERLTAEAGGPWTHTCPLRMNSIGPWEYNEGLDTWTIREQLANGLVARHCNFCGSLHPDDLLRLLGEGYTLSASKPGKAYVLDPNGTTVSKFKGVHLTDELRAALGIPA